MVKIRDASIYGEPIAAEVQKGLTPDHRRIKVGSLIFSEIGKITEVVEKQHWTEIHTDSGAFLSMASMYYRFRQVREQAHSLKEREVPVVARCGSSGTRRLLQRTYEDRNPRGFWMLAFPDSEMKKGCGDVVDRTDALHENRDRELALAVKETMKRRT